MRVGFDKVILMCNLPKPITPLNRVLKIALGTTFFLTSIYGAVAILYGLPISDKSIILLPIVILIFLFAGACIGIYQSSR